MAKKTKKISVNAFEKVMNDTYIPVKVVEWNGLEITIQKTLPLSDMLSFIENVVKSCFRGDSGEYEPAAKDFAIRTMILEKYANFAMPQNLGHQYDLLYCTDACETVLKHINTAQFEEIFSAIDDKIDYMKQANIFAFKKQMNSFTAALENFEEQMSQFDTEDIGKLMGTLSGSKIDEDKLVKAYIENKMSADN